MVPVINSSISRKLNLISVGKIFLKGVVGDPVRADLVKLGVRLTAGGNESTIMRDASQCNFVTITCASLDSNEQLILTTPTLYS